MFLVALRKTASEQDGNIGQQVTFAHEQGVLETGIKLRQLALGRRQTAKCLARLAAQGANGIAHVALVSQIKTMIGREISGFLGSGLRQRGGKAEASSASAEHAVVDDSGGQGFTDAGQLLLRRVDRRSLCLCRTSNVGTERGEKDKCIRKVQPLPQPFAKIVFRINGFRRDFRKNPDETGAIERGALQSIGHGKGLCIKPKRAQGYYKLATWSALSPKPCRGGGLGGVL